MASAAIHIKNMREAIDEGVVPGTFAKGRTAFVRNLPEADSDTNFDTKLTKHRGYVRFSFRLEAGSWHYPSPEEARNIGLAEAH